MTNRGIDPIINDMLTRFMNCEGGHAEKITAMLDKFETELTDAIEEFSYEFIDAPDPMLAPDDDPNHDIALEVQGVFTARLLAEHFAALLDFEKPAMVYLPKHNMLYDENAPE
jgi:hypothetical protein